VERRQQEIATCSGAATADGDAAVARGAFSTIPGTFRFAEDTINGCSFGIGGGCGREFQIHGDRFTYPPFRSALPLP
jgi:hypothetical protein